MEETHPQEGLSTDEKNEEFWKHHRRRGKRGVKRPPVKPLLKKFVDISSFLVAHALPKMGLVLPSHSSMIAGGHYGALDTGKYFIFWEEFDQFYQLYAASVNDDHEAVSGTEKKGMSHHLSEESGFLKRMMPGKREYGFLGERNKRYFKFYIDLDPKNRELDDDFVNLVVDEYKKAMAKVFDLDAIPPAGGNNPKRAIKQLAMTPANKELKYEGPREEHPALKHYVLRNSVNHNKVHIHFPAIIVNKRTAVFIRKMVMHLPAFRHIPLEEREDLFDANYAGLRMLGSFKMDKKKTPWEAIAGTYLVPPSPKRDNLLTVEDLHRYSIKPDPNLGPTPKLKKKRLTSKEKRDKRKQSKKRKKKRESE